MLYLNELKKLVLDVYLLNDLTLVSIIAFTFLTSFLTCVVVMLALRSKSVSSVSSITHGINKRSIVDWIPGVNQPIPFSSLKTWSDFNPIDLKKSNGLYGLMISTIVPRPIALVTSLGDNGVVNCAPFSYFNMVSHDPPLLVIGCNLNTRTASKKDTLINVEQSGEFVVNIMSSWFVESANHTSGMFPSDKSEIEPSGLTTIKSELVQPPRIAESAVQFECEVYELKPILNDEGIHTVTVIYGRVKRIHVHEEVLVANSAKSGKPVVDHNKLMPVGRLGGDTYTAVNNGFDLLRPKV